MVTLGFSSKIPLNFTSLSDQPPLKEYVFTVVDPSGSPVEYPIGAGHRKSGPLSSTLCNGMLVAEIEILMVVAVQGLGIIKQGAVVPARPVAAGNEVVRLNSSLV
jgi:hypothetical protein